MQDVEHWGVLTIGTGLGNARFTNRKPHDDSAIDAACGVPSATIERRRDRPGGRREAGAICLCEGALGRRMRSSCSAAGRGAAAGRRPEPDRHAQHAAVAHRALLVDINGIGGLDGIALKDGMVEIGALVRHAAGRALGRHRAARAADRAGDAAYRPSGDPQPRHHRRLDRLCRSGGRTAGLPAGARRRGRRSPGRRARARVKADDFFKGLFETALAPRDVLTAIRVPAARRRHAHRLRRIGAPPRRLRDGRARRLRARRRQGPAGCPPRLFRRRRDAGARAQRRGGARRRRRRCGRRRRSIRSRSARRHAGDRRREEASRRRAAAARRARN